MNYYWNLELKDSTVIKVAPKFVDSVKKRINNGENIFTKDRLVFPREIESFKKTDKIYSDKELLLAVAQAFKEPQFNEEGEIVSVWVKRDITNERWNRYFINLPGYRLLDKNGMVTIAYRLPVHLVDNTKTSYCTIEDVRKVTKNDAK